MMRVTVYAVDQNTGVETLQASGVDLADVEPDEAEQAWLRHNMHAVGRIYIGGGAAPAFALMPEPESDA